MKKYSNALAILILLTLMAGCAARPTRLPEGELDTPEYNYQQGKKYLEVKQYAQALDAFKRASMLNPKFAPAYEGIGLVHLAEGNFQEAIKNFLKSKKRDKNYVPAYVGLARVHIKQDKLDDALEILNEALYIDTSNADARFYKGEVYLKQYDFDEAAYWFAKTLDVAPGYMNADSEWQRANKIQRAQPGSKVGTQLALVGKITRADLAALFVEELSLSKRFKTSPILDEPNTSLTSLPMVSDIKEHWAQGYINIVINLGIMEVYPDHAFHPDEPVRRADFAIMVQNLMVKVLKQEELTTKFISAPSPFSDVETGEYAFNAIILVTTRGIIEANFVDGGFNPSGPVSGADALLALRKLRGMLDTIP